MQGAADSRLDHPPGTSPHLVDRRFAVLAGLSILAICVLLWFIGWHARGWISAWPRFADDAYYYLVISRNAATGHGFTMDQMSPTNGFQPLWMWTLMPISRLLGDDPRVLLLTVQALCVAIFATAGGLLCGLVRTQLGLIPALVAGLLLLFPRIENVAVSGMESGLVLVVVLALMIEVLRSGSLQGFEPRAADARTGALAGLLMLARLDSVFVCVTLALFVGLRGLILGDGVFAVRLARTVRKELALFWPAVVLVTPYLVWNLVAFGHLVPISGLLKTGFPEAGFVPSHLNAEHFALFLLALGGVGLESWRGNARAPLIQLLAVMSVGLALHAVFAVVFMRWAVFSWHFAALIPVGAIGAALIAREAVERLPRALVIAGLVLLTLLQCAALAFSLSRLAQTFTVAGREAGDWVAHNLPPDAVLGMKDSGIFSYFSRRRVMNLDGVANNLEFAAAVCQGRIEAYVRSHGVQYIAQHAVSLQVREGNYGTFTQAYPCGLDGGEDGVLALREEHEVYRGSLYKKDSGQFDQMVIWRLAPTAEAATPPEARR